MDLRRLSQTALAAFGALALLAPSSLALAQTSAPGAAAADPSVDAPAPTATKTHKKIRRTGGPATLAPTGAASSAGVIGGMAPNAGGGVTRTPAALAPPIGSGGATGSTTISGRPPG